MNNEVVEHTIQLRPGLRLNADIKKDISLLEMKALTRDIDKVFKALGVHMDELFVGEEEKVDRRKEATNYPADANNPKDAQYRVVYTNEMRKQVMVWYKGHMPYKTMAEKFEKKFNIKTTASKMSALVYMIRHKQR
jgi:hypothetical protein